MALNLIFKVSDIDEVFLGFGKKETLRSIIVLLKEIILNFSMEIIIFGFIDLFIKDIFYALCFYSI